MRVEAQRAYVLHQRDYSETSLLIELFSRAYGRVGVIAKGARQPRSRRRALLAPFQPLLVSWSGKSELAVLTEVETADAALNLVGQALYCGFYVNELILRLVHRHDPHEGLFVAYESCLQDLGAESGPEPALRRFEYRLLLELGYGLVLDQDVANNEAIEAAGLYRYVPDEGPYPVVSGSDLSVGIHVHGETLLALARGEFDQRDSMAEMKVLLRELIAHRLDYKPLQSRRILGALSSRRLSGREGEEE